MLYYAIVVCSSSYEEMLLFADQDQAGVLVTLDIVIPRFLRLGAGSVPYPSETKSLSKVCGRFLVVI